MFCPETYAPEIFTCTDKPAEISSMTESLPEIPVSALSPVQAFPVVKRLRCL